MTDEASKNRQKLNMATSLKRLVAAFEAVGFSSVEAQIPTLEMNLNDETEVILYPGVERRLGGILIDPVVVIHNTKLNAILMNSGWKGSLRVCHFYLSLMCSWNRLYVNDEAELESAIYLVVESFVEVGMRVVNAYNSLEKVINLFQDDMAHRKTFSVAVLFAKEKLERIRMAGSPER